MVCVCLHTTSSAMRSSNFAHKCSITASRFLITHLLFCSRPESLFILTAYLFYFILFQYVKAEKRSTIRGSVFFLISHEWPIPPFVMDRVIQNNNKRQTDRKLRYEIGLCWWKRNVRDVHVTMIECYAAQRALLWALFTDWVQKKDYSSLGWLVIILTGMCVRVGLSLC